jgi:hypothetical protein
MDEQELKEVEVAEVKPEEVVAEPEKVEEGTV